MRAQTRELHWFRPDDVSAMQCWQPLRPQQAQTSELLSFPETMNDSVQRWQQHRSEAAHLWNMLQ